MQHESRPTFHLMMWAGAESIAKNIKNAKIIKKRICVPNTFSIRNNDYSVFPFRKFF